MRAIIDAEPDLTVVGEASDGAEVRTGRPPDRPDVVMMDVRMPGSRRHPGHPAAARRTRPPPRVLVVTTFENDDYVYDALARRRVGLPPQADPARRDRASHPHRRSNSESLLFPQAIRSLALAHVREQRACQPTGLDHAQLTEREQEVLRLMARGLSNAEIATELVLGVQTIKTHVANLLAKLGARDRTQAVIMAYESGFVPVR